MSLTSYQAAPPRVFLRKRALHWLTRFRNPFLKKFFEPQDTFSVPAAKACPVGNNPKADALLARESLITVAPQNDKCVVVTVRRPRTGRYFAILNEPPVTRIFDAKTQVIADRGRHI
jgi:hypothetical protein